MDEPVQMPGGLLDRLPHVIFAVEVENVRDQVERVLVIMHFGVEASQIKAVRDVLFVDFAKVFIAAGGDELETSKWGELAELH